MVEIECGKMTHHEWENNEKKKGQMFTFCIIEITFILCVSRITFFDSNNENEFFVHVVYERCFILTFNIIIVIIIESMIHTSRNSSVTGQFRKRERSNECQKTSMNREREMETIRLSEMRLSQVIYHV